MVEACVPEISGPDVVRALSKMDITHVVWVPDSVIGRWESDLEQATNIQLIRVCREGEAWPLASGLLLGEKKPIVMMQCTGLFESGDALRNALFDLHSPVFALIGVRNGRSSDSQDSAKTFTASIVEAWQANYVTIRDANDLGLMVDHYHQCQREGAAGMVLLEE